MSIQYKDRYSETYCCFSLLLLEVNFVVVVLAVILVLEGPVVLVLEVVPA